MGARDRDIYHRSILHAVQDEIGVILTIVCMHGCVCVIV